MGRRRITNADKRKMLADFRLCRSNGYSAVEAAANAGAALQSIRRWETDADLSASDVAGARLRVVREDGVEPTAPPVRTPIVRHQVRTPVVRTVDRVEPEPEPEPVEPVVEVEPETSSTGARTVTLVTPDGYRISGITVEDLTMVLKEIR